MNVPSSSETAKPLQQFVNAHPWLFALAWVMIFPMSQLISWLISDFHLSPVTSLSVRGMIIRTGLIVAAFVFLSLLRWWRQTGFTEGIRGKDVLVCLFPTLLTLFIAFGAFSPFIFGLMKISLDRLAFVAIYACLIGVAEESIFRGIILQTLLPKGVLRALFLSTLIFALLHVGNLFAGLSWGYILGQVLNAFGVGMAYAVMRVRTGSIWPAVILHSLTDFGALTLITTTGVKQYTLLSGLFIGGIWCSLYVIYAAIALRPSRLSELRTRYQFEQVEGLNPAAADLLRFCAFLAPDAIPEQLVIDGAAELGPRLQPIATDISLLNEAIGTLLRFSLVKRNRAERMLIVHRPVQNIMRTGMDTATQQTWAERTVRAINQAFLDATDYRNWPQCQRYLPHAQACVLLIDHWTLTIPEAGRLLNQVGYYLDDRAQYAEAEPLYQRAISIDEKTLGPEHPDLATQINNLALLYYHQGKYEQAEPLYQRAISIDEKTLGPEHPDTAQSLNNLALLYADQGKYEQAEPLYQHAIAIDEQVLGPEHPTTKTIRENHAKLLKKMKRKRKM